MVRNDSLGNRIKRYEAVYSPKLTPRSPVFIRVDGKSFHTYTRGMDKPFDRKLIDAMVHAAHQTSIGMEGFKLAYVQSDECTFLLTDYDTLQTQGWFDYELNKLVSITASAFTAYFNRLMGDDHPPAFFDARAFTVPESDIANVFLWRQKDWARNSIQMLARHHYSHQELKGKKVSDIHEMLYQKGINWTDLPGDLKNGTFINRKGGRSVDVLPNYESIATLVEEIMEAVDE